MYVYVAVKEGQQTEFYENAKYNEATGEFVSKTVAKPREIAYYRKHPNLHGWMEQLWRSKTPDASKDRFNGVELELTWDDIDLLENDILNNQLPSTTGFFFGDPADDYYKQKDLEFVKNARAELFMGLRVFYNSSW
jgi:uncharacterized protein YciU (UPF0263 family)